ncbi:hypothetical protein EG329_000063 [Mollisiaceae sp. DMI_Dod_QoI]|nr:hypothetical protein EG329_000063 [Helotiales sp. DMI_Dod_QoI]
MPFTPFAPTPSFRQIRFPKAYKSPSKGNYAIVLASVHSIRTHKSSTISTITLFYSLRLFAMSRSANRRRNVSSPKPCLKSPKKSPRSTPRHSRAPDSRRSSASDQRDVFDWYEKYQYKADAGDIFSPEWQCRLTDWSNEFEQDIENLRDIVAQHEQYPEKLELGLFFLAYPVVAFSLWHLLQACYELDRRICGTSKLGESDIAEWQNWRPFQYLRSTNIMSTWKDNLVSLTSQVERSNDEFKKEAVASRLYTIDEGVGLLEEALSTVESVFDEGKQKSMRCSPWVLDLIHEGVGNRSRAIEEHIHHHPVAP